MPTQSPGKWVTRAASTGGGRTYRGQVPINWYLALVAIVIVGLFSVIYSRYEYRKGTSNTNSTVAPTVGGSPYFSALGIDICGSQATPLPANANASTVGLTTAGNGVIVLEPKKSGEAGKNATLGKFVSEYPGLKLTPTSFTYPGQGETSNGTKCPKGTPDAGKKGTVQVKYWTTFESKTGSIVADPSTLKIGNNSLITVSYLPSGKSIPKPPGTVISAMLQTSNGATASSTTPTTIATTPTTTTPTTAPSSTPTTQPASSTTTTS